MTKKTYAVWYREEGQYNWYLEIVEVGATTKKLDALKEFIAKKRYEEFQKSTRLTKLFAKIGDSTFGEIAFEGLI